jgi:hypothetical protein
MEVAVAVAEEVEKGRTSTSKNSSPMDSQSLAREDPAMAREERRG